MRKIMLAIAGLLSIILSRAQGVHELWGITIYGGTNDAGMIFKTDARGNNFQVVHNFLLTNSPRYISGRLTFLNGKLYGMSTYGGVADKGVIFEIDPATGVYTERLSRDNDINGRTGWGTLVPYGNKLYGGGLGGTTDQGVIFEWDPVTNIYTKKIDLTGETGAAPGYLIISALTLVGNKFYGTTRGGGVPVGSLLFEWDPVTNIYTKKMDLGLGIDTIDVAGLSLAEGNGKLYGTILGAGDNVYGLIFEYDPVTNIYTKKIDFNIHGQNGGTPGIEGAQPYTGLTRCGDKFYGATIDGGFYGTGVLYEWDPVTNLPSEFDPLNNRYIVKQDFDGVNSGRLPQVVLSSIGGRLYGIAPFGGLYDEGTFFEFDPATNIFTKKLDFNSINGNPGGSGENGVVAVYYSIAPGTPGVCAGFPSIFIDNSNNNTWVPIFDNLGRAIAEIKANGNNLGTVSIQLYTHNATVREDAAKRLYLDRNLTITPQVQPTTPVDIRLYIRTPELDALKTAINSSGQPSGVNTASDLAIFKNTDACNASLNAGAVPVLTTVESWTDGYVLSASINDFSSFYFANKANATLPLDFISFTGKLVDNDAALDWKTENEISTSYFEIERSMDGRNYSVAGRVNSVNTPGIHNYSFKDLNVISPGSTVIYYRLRQIDIGGRFTYSPVVVLNIKNNPVVLFYPNPVSGKANLTVTLKASEQLQLRVIDNMGRVVKRQQWNLSAGSTSLSVDVKGLMKGLYYLELKGNTISKQLNFLKQ